MGDKEMVILRAFNRRWRIILTLPQGRVTLRGPSFRRKRLEFLLVVMQKIQQMGKPFQYGWQIMFWGGLCTLLSLECRLRLLVAQYAVNI